jgi:hypothetical protein
MYVNAGALRECPPLRGCGTVLLTAGTWYEYANQTLTSG